MARRPRKQKSETKYEMNLMELTERFHSEEKVRAYLEELRWPDGMICPRCESQKISRSYKRNQFVCDTCDYNFSVTSGTMLHDTHLPLRKWMIAVYLMCESKKGISANQLKRTIGVAYKTAWYLSHRIRDAMAQTRETPSPLSGIVEADETFIGGKTEGFGRGYKGNKAIVVGVIQRKGQVILEVVDDRTRKTLREFVLGNTKPETEAIYTDDWPAYQGIGDHDTRHETVNHSQDEYVRGEVHTNSAESVWSLLERSIMGAYHHVSVKHLQAYLDELEWRFSNRENPFLFRDILMELLRADHVEYKELTA